MKEKTNNLISRADIPYHKQLEPMGNGQYNEVEVAYKDDVDALPSAEGGDAEPNPIPTGTGVMIQSPNGADLISRADAIEAVRNGDVLLDYDIEWSYDVLAESASEQTRDCLVHALKALPSAEAVQGWIPCSERLPSAEDCPMDCMVTRRSKYVGNYTDMAVAEADGTWTHEDWKAITINGDATCISTRDADIIAWMPLPKPYREDGE